MRTAAAALPKRPACSAVRPSRSATKNAAANTSPAPRSSRTAVVAGRGDLQSGPPPGTWMDGRGPRAGGHGHTRARGAPRRRARRSAALLLADHGGVEARREQRRVERDERDVAGSDPPPGCASGMPPAASRCRAGQRDPFVRAPTAHEALGVTRRTRLAAPGHGRLAGDRREVQDRGCRASGGSTIGPAHASTRWERLAPEPAVRSVVVCCGRRSRARRARSR